MYVLFRLKSTDGTAVKLNLIKPKNCMNAFYCKTISNYQILASFELPELYQTPVSLRYS